MNKFQSMIKSNAYYVTIELSNGKFTTENRQIEPSGQHNVLIPDVIERLADFKGKSMAFVEIFNDEKSLQDHREIT